MVQAEILEVSDEQLLRKFAAGDRSALEGLARRYELPLLGLSRGLLGGREDLARDAVQETWMRVIRFASSFNGRSSAKTWLYRIAINQCRSVQKNSSRKDRKSESSDVEERQVMDDQAMHAERNHVLQRAVDKLPQDRRAVVLLCYHADLTHEHAAAILGLPLGTLKSRLHAALTELRATLSREECT